MRSLGTTFVRDELVHQQAEQTEENRVHVDGASFASLFFPASPSFDIYLTACSLCHDRASWEVLCALFVHFGQCIPLVLVLDNLR